MTFNIFGLLNRKVTQLSMNNDEHLSRCLVRRPESVLIKAKVVFKYSCKYMHKDVLTMTK